MRRKEAQVTKLNPTSSGSGDLTRVARTGRITAIDDAGVITVWIHGEKHPAQARVAVPVSVDQVKGAIESKQAVLLLIDAGEPERPILVGFVENRVTPEPAQVVQADVDGKRVRVVGQDEIVFECGSASITLRRNGRIVIKGAYVETHSDGTNRIKGGQVRIN